MAGQVADVFVSYKAEDRARIRPLVGALEAEGITVWWDTHIGAGAHWREDIQEHLDAAKCVVVAWTKRSIGHEGNFVRDEASRAQRRGVYLPIRLDPVEPPLGFGEVQAISLDRWRGDPSDPRFLALADAIRECISGEHVAPHAEHHPQHRISRRELIAGGAVAAATVVAAGAWEWLKPSAASASPSIAVLPFANLSGDPAQAYFSDGIADQIRSSLARLGGLTVIGSTSSEAVRNDDARTAAKKLGVSSILTGNVRQSPTTIRIAAELIDGRTGADRWTEDYDRPPGDAIKIQTDIAENVAGALGAALGVAVRKSISIGGTANTEAQRLFLQAKAAANGSISQAALQQAMRLLDSATIIDPNYADAYALKSETLTLYGNSYSNGAEDLAFYRAESLRLAQLALRIGPDLPAAHRALFGFYSSNLEMTPAYREIKRAVQLAPADAETLTNYARFTGTVLDEMDQAFMLSDQAIASDPLNPDPYTHRVFLLFFARRYQELVEYGKRLKGDSSKLFNRSFVIGNALVMLGRFPEAQSYFIQAPPDFWGRITGEALLLIRRGDRAGGQERLAKLQHLFGDAASAQIAEIYAQLGDRDSAFAALDRGFAIKDGGLVALRVDPFLDPLRSDPRFAALLREMNFPA